MKLDIGFVTKCNVCDKIIHDVNKAIPCHDNKHLIHSNCLDLQLWKTTDTLKIPNQWCGKMCWKSKVQNNKFWIICIKLMRGDHLQKSFSLCRPSGFLTPVFPNTVKNNRLPIFFESPCEMLPKNHYDINDLL